MGWEFEVNYLSKELVRDLNEDASAIAGVFFCANGASVIEVHKRSQAGIENVVSSGAAQRRDECNSTGVVLVRRVIESLCGLLSSPYSLALENLLCASVLCAHRRPYHLVLSRALRSQ